MARFTKPEDWRIVEVDSVKGSSIYNFLDQASLWSHWDCRHDWDHVCYPAPEVCKNRCLHCGTVEAFDVGIL